MRNCDQEITLVEAGAKKQLVATNEDDPVERYRKLERRDPRARIRAAVVGRGRVSPDDVSALVAGHLIELDQVTKEVGEFATNMLRFAFQPHQETTDLDAVLDDECPQSTGCPNLSEALGVAERLADLHHKRLAQLRQTANLLCRLTQPPRRVRVVAATTRDDAALSVDLGDV